MTFGNFSMHSDSSGDYQFDTDAFVHRPALRWRLVRNMGTGTIGIYPKQTLARAVLSISNSVKWLARGPQLRILYVGFPKLG